MKCGNEGEYKVLKYEVTILFCIVTSQIGVTIECRSLIQFNFTSLTFKYSEIQSRRKTNSIVSIISIAYIFFLTASLLYEILNI